MVSKCFPLDVFVYNGQINTNKFYIKKKSLHREQINARKSKKDYTQIKDLKKTLHRLWYVVCVGFF
jgi:hypothetical protein